MLSPALSYASDDLRGIRGVVEAEENAAHFNATAHVYDEAELVEHDAIVAWPLYDRAVAQSSRQSTVPRVLDIGAGVGISALPMLERGCRVTAVDVAEEALNRLRARAGDHAERLETVACEGGEFLECCAADSRLFDIVLCRALLHHIPDYLGMIRQAIPVIAPGGCFLTLAEPMRYDSVTKFERCYSQATYYTMRLFMGNYVRGLRTLLRRSRGELSSELAEDNVEYHAVRNGVDQEAIERTFVEAGFRCEITPYFGWANPVMRPIGRWLGVRSSFACIGTRPA